MTSPTRPSPPPLTASPPGPTRRPRTSVTWPGSSRAPRRKRTTALYLRPAGRKHTPARDSRAALRAYGVRGTRFPRAARGRGPLRMRDYRHPRRTSLALMLVAALAAVALASSARGEAGSASSSTRTRSAVPGEILVGFKGQVSAAAQSDVLAGVGARRKRRFAGIRGELVSVAPERLAGTIRSLERDGRVAYAEPNFVLRADVPNDPFINQLWGLDNFGQTVNWTAGTPDADIDAREAWSVSTGSPKRSEERRVGKECRSRWSPNH